MLGAGIFALTGTLVSQVAGPAAALSYLLAALAAVFVAGCYIELSTSLPHAGSVYVYTYFAIGELPAFIVGWTLISVPLVSVPAVAKAFSAALDSVFSSAITNWEVHSRVLFCVCTVLSLLCCLELVREVRLRFLIRLLSPAESVLFTPERSIYVIFINLERFLTCTYTSADIMKRKNRSHFNALQCKNILVLVL